MDNTSSEPPPAHAPNQSNPQRQRRIRPNLQRARRGANRNMLRTREGFFMHYLFITISMRYANYFKPKVRRFIEFFALLKAICMLLLMVYIHVTFVKNSGDCLAHVEDIWPKNGVLKVQVQTNSTLPPYQLYFAKAHPESWATSFHMDPYQAIFKYSVTLGKDGLPKFKRRPPTSPNTMLKSAREHIFGVRVQDQSAAINYSKLERYNLRDTLLKKFADVAAEVDVLGPVNVEDIPNWVLLDPSISDNLAEIRQMQMYDISGLHVGPQLVREYYAIEYSTEFGYLRLSSAARYKLGIPVMVVTLDPERDACFGTGLKNWMLKTFYGYDDLVMGSIKRLAEKTNRDGAGFLRNLVTAEHFKFITLWVGHSSYMLAFIVMLLFTLIVTMLLRYSYHQIFVFMVELVNLLDTDVTVVFPAAPMLTIILALVGTEEIMTEFFQDSTLAFYVILSVWIADQFDAICMHTVISRRHWVRFFFIYHFAFYAYHYRYNGQFSELALFTSWLFIQHSMFYFIHHYEIPAIQRQIRISQVFLRDNNNNAGNPPPENSRPDTPQTPAPEGPPPGPAQEQGDSSEGNGDDAPQTEHRQTSDGTEVANSVSNPSDGVRIHQPRKTFESKTLLRSDDAISFESHDEDLVKAIAGIELWDDFAEESTVQGSEGVFKYCNLIMMLVLAVSSMILVFLLSAVIANQGRFSVKMGGYSVEKVGEFL